MRLRRAFTLIELLIALAAVSLLVVVLLPALGDERDNRRNCRNNQKQLSLALIMYRDIMGKSVRYPPFDGSAFLVHLYSSGQGLEANQYLCPSAGDDNSKADWRVTGATDAMTSYAGRRNATQSSYPGLYTAKGASETSTISDDSTPEGGAVFNHGDACIVAFMDGHNEEIPLTDARLKGVTAVGPGNKLLDPLAN